MYWEQREDTMNSLVENAISRKLFNSIIWNTYFVDRITPDPSENSGRSALSSCSSTRLPRITSCSLRTSLWMRVHQVLWPHPLKKYMNGKPHRLGYKV
jgi:hypothetical protein